MARFHRQNSDTRAGGTSPGGGRYQAGIKPVARPVGICANDPDEILCSRFGNKLQKSLEFANSEHDQEKTMKTAEIFSPPSPSPLLSRSRVKPPLKN